MDKHQLGRIGAGLVGVGRTLTGAYFLARPANGAEAWVGDAGPASRYLARSVGGRDLVIGAGVVWSLVSPDETPLPWVLASVAGDLVDAGFGATMLDDAHRSKAVALAGGFGVLGAVTAALLASS